MAKGIAPAAAVADPGGLVECFAYCVLRSDMPGAADGGHMQAHMHIGMVWQAVRRVAVWAFIAMER